MSRLPVRAGVLMLGVIALAIVVTADYVTSYELQLSAFYMLVTLAVAWFCGAWWGALFACLSAFAQLEIGLDAGATFSEPVYFYVANGNRLFAYLLTAFLVAAVRTNYERLRSAARIDYVTGVTNSIGFYENVSIEIARHRRSRASLTVAYYSCDYFKVINEGLGRSEGDRVLRLIGQVAKSSLRETDVVARLGGDEFAMVFPQTGEAEALQVVRKLSAQLENAMSRHDWPITFSVGVGVFPSVPASVDEAVAFCERVMQRVKASGRNRVMVRVFDPGGFDSVRRAPLHVVR